MLVENSLKHGYDASRTSPMQIKVRADLENGKMVLRVSEDGKGVQADRLVDLGNRPVTSPNGYGTGLHVLSQLVSLGYDGTLRVYSAAGIGTRVKLTLPLRKWHGR